MKKKVKLTLIFFIVFFLSNCISIAEKTGQILDGSVFEEKIITSFNGYNENGSLLNIKISIIENREKQKSLIFTFNNFPMFKLRADIPDENGIFQFLSLDYLAGNTHGWNEFSLQIFGSGYLIYSNSAGELEVTETIEHIQITHGRIHRYDTRITGNEALIALRNRSDRISALAAWMLNIENAPKGQTIKNFENFWKPILFPELVSKRKRPNNWCLSYDSFQKSNDIRWNTGYTERVFSEELWQVRNTGTLLRDWEEALMWIYMEYEWSNVLELLSNKIFLQGI